ncbi:MAG: hypothetical protein NT169_01905, partial [Chloroflexi bacterium]|nr:hypothetical protein [Chloroflexota bacterium]
LAMIAGAQQYATRLARERGIRGFNVRVGINTGLVVVGELGSDLRMEYVVRSRDDLQETQYAVRTTYHAPRSNHGSS